MEPKHENWASVKRTYLPDSYSRRPCFVWVYLGEGEYFGSYIVADPFGRPKSEFRIKMSKERPRKFDSSTILRLLDDAYHLNKPPFIDEISEDVKKTREHFVGYYLGTEKLHSLLESMSKKWEKYEVTPEKLDLQAIDNMLNFLDEFFR